MTLRDPVGTRAEGNTTDLVVDGVTWDVYTRPWRFREKPHHEHREEVRPSPWLGVIVDLSTSPFSAGQLGNVLGRANGMIRSWGKSPLLGDVYLRERGNG